MVAILFSSPGSVLAEDMDNEPNRPASSIRFFTAEGVFPNVMGVIVNQAGAQGQAIPTALLLEFEDLTLMLFEPDPEQPLCLLLSDGESFTYIFAPVTGDRVPEEEISIIRFWDQYVVIHMPWVEDWDTQSPTHIQALRCCPYFCYDHLFGDQI